MGEEISPLVPNPDYQPGGGQQIVEDCYLEYGPGGGQEVCDYYDENPKMIRRLGTPELYMMLSFWIAVFSLRAFKKRFLDDNWLRLSWKKRNSKIE